MNPELKAKLALMIDSLNDNEKKELIEYMQNPTWNVNKKDINLDGNITTKEHKCKRCRQHFI